MLKYSITLNFFVPKKIVEDFKEIEISEKLIFNWRETNYSHCTIKTISLCDKIPHKEILNNWIIKTQNILVSQTPFIVKIQDISNFPTSTFACVKSDELIKLHKKLFKVFPNSQPQFENDNYIPHISLSMLKDNEFKSYTKKCFGEFFVDEIQLLTWNLKELDKPAIYHRFSLTK